MAGATHVDVQAPGGTATMPHSQEYENDVVGVAFLYPQHADTLFDALTADDFFTEAARRHFIAMLGVHRGGEVVDRPALQRVMGDSCEIGYLNGVSHGMPAGVNVEGLIRALREFTQRRGLVTTAKRVLNEAILGTEAPADQVEAARDAFDRLLDDRAGETGPEPSEAITSRLLAAQDDPPPSGLSSGISDLDGLLGRRGFAGGDLIVGAARTGVGKTILACQLAAHAVLRRQAPTVFFALEMTGDSVVERMAIAEARVSATDVRDRVLSAPDSIRYAAALGKLRDAPLLVDDRSSTVQRVRRVARRLHRRTKLGLIVVDYLQRLNPTPGEKYESRALEVARWTKALKDLAMELKVPVLVLAQLNRETVRLSGLPQLHHLKESGSIEQDADTVLLIHRLVRDDPDEITTTKPSDAAWVPADQARIIVAKHRHGPTGMVTVRWSGEHQRFDGLTEWRESAA
jgi:replicative DNA helicase